MRNFQKITLLRLQSFSVVELRFLPVFLNTGFGFLEHFGFQDFGLRMLDLHTPVLLTAAHAPVLVCTGVSSPQLLLLLTLLFPLYMDLIGR